MMPGNNNRNNSGAASREREPAAEWVTIETVQPWQGNPRRNDAAVQRVADSIKRFGFGAPIVARRANGEIIAGHTRYRAALELGLREVPVRFVDLDPAEAHLLALADNKLNELATWDDDALADLLSSIPRRDVELLGFSELELKALLAQYESTDDPLNRPVTEIDDKGMEPITVRVLMVQVARAREVIAQALAAAGIEFST